MSLPNAAQKQKLHDTSMESAIDNSNLLFGVEIEFYLLVPYPKGMSPTEQFRYYFTYREEVLLQMFKAAGFLVSVNPDDQWTHHVIKEDASITADGNDTWNDCWVFPVEISTFPQRLYEKSEAEITKLADFILSIGGQVNASTGLHVHVSPGRDQEFSLKTLKNLAHLVTIAQNQINMFHDKHRLLSQYCTVPRSQFTDANIHKMVSEIEGFKSVKALICRMNRPVWVNISDPIEGYDEVEEISPPVKYSAVNFCNTASFGGKKASGTVEFRQAAGTLCGRSIWRCVLTYCGFLNYSAQAMANPAGELLEKYANWNSGYDALDLLNDIGCSRVAEMWKDDLRDHGPPPEEGWPLLHYL